MDIMDFLWWRRRRFFQSLLIIWISTVLTDISEACSTRGAPKARSPPQAAILPGQAQQHQTPQQAGQQNASIPHFDCPSAYQKWYCLNGASCFAVKIGDTILYNCRCALGYQGQRCEYKDTDESYSYSRARYMVKQATIAGVTTAAIFIVIIVIIAVTIYVRRRRQTKRAEPSMSVEAAQGTPFGRTLSRTDQFAAGRPKSPSDGPLFTPLPTGVPSTSTGAGRKPKIPEQEALLSQVPALLDRVERFGPAPVARTSDATLSDEVVITMEPYDSPHIARELPHPYSLPMDNSHAGSSRLPVGMSSQRTIFTTGS